MPVQYRSIDGELVSSQWYTVLRDLRAAGVRFTVTEGKRTFARQRQLRQLYLNGRGALAAIPSHNAPHIRTGRFDHANDFGNAAGVMYALRRRGIRCALTVPGERWHVEANAADLQRYHQRHHGRVSVLPIKRGRRNNPAAVKKLQRRLRAIGFKTVRVDGVYGRKTRSAVGRFQRHHKLHVDYTVGRKTWDALARAVR